MSIRGTVWLQIVDPFDGPRIGPPLHMKWAAKNVNIFHDLELVIAGVYKTIASQPPTAWQRLSETSQPPEINGRHIKLNVRTFENPDLDLVVLMRACLPFPAWPLGGWVVIEGWNRTNAGVWIPLTAEELGKIW